MHKRSVQLCLLFLLFPAFSFAQCKSSSINLDSIFNYWSGASQEQGLDSLLSAHTGVDTVITFSDSSGIFGTMHLKLGSDDGGIDFSFKNPEPFGAENFFPDFFSNDSPFGISLDFDNMFRQLENMFEDFKGIEVIPQPEEKKSGGKPVYRI